MIQMLSTINTKLVSLFFCTNDHITEMSSYCYDSAELDPNADADAMERTGVG